MCKFESDGNTLIVFIKDNSSQSSDEESGTETIRMRQEIHAKDREIDSLKRQISDMKGELFSFVYCANIHFN